MGVSPLLNHVYRAQTVSAHRSAAKALAGYMASPKAPTLLELKRDFRAAYGQHRLPPRNDVSTRRDDACFLAFFSSVAGVKASMVPEGLAGSSAGRFVGR